MTQHFQQAQTFFLLKYARKKEICHVVHHQPLCFFTQSPHRLHNYHIPLYTVSQPAYLNWPGRCYHGVICWRNPWCRCQIKLPPYWIVMSASNVSKVYWRARCGLGGLGGLGVEVGRELEEVDIDWGNGYVAVLKDYVFSFVIFGNPSKNTKTKGLILGRKDNTVAEWCHKPSKKRSILNLDCLIEDSIFCSWQFGASKLFLLDRMKLPEFVQKSCAINCHRLRILHGCMLDTMLRRRNGVRQKHSDFFLGLAVG